MTTPELKHRILDANRRMHSLPGYVADYDARNPYMVNRLAQREFIEDLRRIHRRHQSGAAIHPFTALDLGAGTGNLTIKLLRLGYDVTALDLSPAMLQQLQNKADCLPGPIRRRLSTTISDAESFLTAPGPAFDAIVMCSFLHHLPEYARILTLCAKRLSPRGIIYFVHEPLPPRPILLSLRALGLADRAAFLLRGGRLGERLAGKIFPGRRHCESAGEHALINQLTRLADYHVFQRGIEPHVIRRTFQARGLEYRLGAYTLMNTATATRLARWAGVKDMIKGFAWIKRQ